METSYYKKKSILVKMIEKIIYYITLIYVTIAHKSLILLKQEFSHAAFLHHRVEAKPKKWKCVYSQC